MLIRGQTNKCVGEGAEKTTAREVRKKQPPKAFLEDHAPEDGEAAGDAEPSAKRQRYGDA